MMLFSKELVIRRKLLMKKKVMVIFVIVLTEDELIIISDGCDCADDECCQMLHYRCSCIFINIK